MSGTWSSFSTPVAAGAAGLLIQAAKQDKRLDGILSPEGGNCLLEGHPDDLGHEAAVLAQGPADPGR